MKTSGSSSNRQSKRRTGKTWRTCFIAAPLRVNINTIKTVLEKKGIIPLVPSELPPTSASLVEHITRAISKADLFIAVLDPTQSNANVYYELGYAHALGKRILVLAPPELKDIPTDIRGELHLRADAENREAIDFALDQALTVPKPTKHKLSQPVAKGRPIGDLADELMNRLKSLGNRATERDVEQIVVTALQASGVSVVTHSGQPDIGADLAIWADELDPWVGNPFLIEIKKHLKTQAQVRELLNRVSTYLQESNLRWALVLYLKGLPSALDLPHVSLSNVIFLTVRELLGRLRASSFGEVVRDLQNRRVHGRNF